MKTPLPQQVHAAIKKRLQDGTWPPGTRLEYKLLASEFGVSTTPVREAVAQLATEGLLELVPRFGAVVRRLSRTLAEELYEVREALETYAARKAAERLTARHSEVLRDTLSTMNALLGKLEGSKQPWLGAADQRLFLEADFLFHQTILQAARNPTLTRTLDESEIQTRAFLTDKGVHDRRRMELACRQHEAILSALEARDGPAAAAAMAEHIQMSLLLTLQALDGKD